MTNEEKFQHDLMTANHDQKLKDMTDMGVLLTAVGILILGGKTSKYDLPPQDAAAAYECFHRADPSFAW